jgi:putative nucleotidyltransferase with HDIG domain
MANDGIPTKEECLNILKASKTPSNVIVHSKAVCRFAEKLADKLEKKGIKLNKELVVAASLLHDVKRAEDNHIAEGAKLLKRMGFPKIAEVIKKHSLHRLDDKNVQPRTYEEKILFYADKRVKDNKVVSLKERFEGLEKKYNVDLKKEFEFTKRIEEELNS